MPPFNTCFLTTTWPLRIKSKSCTCITQRLNLKHLFIDYCTKSQSKVYILVTTMNLILGMSQEQEDQNIIIKGICSNITFSKSKPKSAKIT